jgi:hypothetical protein
VTRLRLEDLTKRFRTRRGDGVTALAGISFAAGSWTWSATRLAGP